MTDYDALHLKLREANNKIAYLEFELESLKQDAGADMHDLMTRHSAKLDAAEALAEAISNYEDDRDFYLPMEITEALRQYREAGK